MDARLYAIIYLAGLQDINSELYEAATVDGANRWQTFTRIVLSLSKASLATLAVLSFLTNLNDFLWPVYVLFTPKCLTLPPRLAILPSAYSTNYTVIMAGGVIASIPVLIASSSLSDTTSRASAAAASKGRRTAAESRHKRPDD